MAGVVGVSLLLGVVAVYMAGAVLRYKPPDRPDRFAAQWRSIELSADRRTITVVTHYPLAGSCVKKPAGVTVEIDGTVARVGAWVSEVGGEVCTAECGIVRQSVTLDEPLPRDVVLQPLAGAVRTCG